MLYYICTAFLGLFLLAMAALLAWGLGVLFRATMRGDEDAREVLSIILAAVVIFSLILSAAYVGSHPAPWKQPKPPVTVEVQP